MKSILVVLPLLVAFLLFGNCDTSGQFVWTKDVRNPVLSGVMGTWNKHVFNPSVLFNPDSARYEMWFNSSPGEQGFPYIHPWSVGFAVSKDGINWTIYPSAVLAPESGKWDSHTIDLPEVIRENGQYKMWYASYKDASSPNYFGYATSPDGIHWTKYSGNPILGPGTAPWEAGGPMGCAVMPVQGGYKMWYGGMNATYTVTTIGYATSTDGVSWKRDTVNSPVLNVGGSTQWDSKSVSIPNVLRVGNAYYMWYVGSNLSGTIEATGLATSSDGVTNWTRYAANPVLVASPGAWDGQWADAATVLLRGDTLHMWYDGWKPPESTNQVKIGYATSTVVAGIVRRVPAQYPTIQAAINAANNGDTVLVSDGKYYENIRFKGKKIVVGSTYLTTSDTSHISKTIIDGSRATNPDSGSVVYFANGEDTTSVLCGFTITGGIGTSYRSPDGVWWRIGGGVFCESAGARLVSNKIVRNRVLGPSPSGGGIGAVSFGAPLPWLIVEGNRIADNYVEGSSTATWASGGGADIGGMSFRLVDNIFERDTAVSGAIAIGGGAELYGTSSNAPFPEGLVQGNVFRNNLADGRRPGGDCAAIGAGVFCGYTGTVVFRDNSFEGNAAIAWNNGWAEGGGICIDDEDVVGAGRKTVSRNRFLGNRVQAQYYSERGGAIDLYYTVATVSGNFISDNSAAGSPAARGGGIRSINSSFRIENNIITRNRSGVWGGGINIQNPPTYGTEQVIVNNTFVGNKATTGGGLDIVNAANVVAFNNILWGDTATTGPEINTTGAAPVIQYCDVAGGFAGTGNINGDPRFITGDTLYNLQAVSPCIGGGIDSLQISGTWYRAPGFDFDGDPRARPLGPQSCDMGAQEEQTTVDVATQELAPTSYELSQNFPNPFNPTTVIRYQLPVAGNVQLVIYDLLGREVAVLVNEKKEPGSYEVKFDGSGLSSGVYFYRIQAGDFVQTRRLLLLK